MNAEAQHAAADRQPHAVVPAAVAELVPLAHRLSDAIVIQADPSLEQDLAVVVAVVDRAEELAAQQLGLDTMRLSHAILRAIWVEERNVALPETRKQIADENGMDGETLVGMEKSDAVTGEYRRNTDEVEALGIFGSPTYVLDGELFWGQDRLEFLERALARRFAEMSKT